MATGQIVLMTGLCLAAFRRGRWQSSCAGELEWISSTNTGRKGTGLPLRLLLTATGGAPPNGVAANGSDPARSFWPLAVSPANWSILEAYAKYPPKSFVGWYSPSGEFRNGTSGIYPGK